MVKPILCRDVLIILTAIVVLYSLFISLRPVEVVAVYHDNNYIDVIVKHFPSDDMDKITWWLDHKKTLSSKGVIPSSSSLHHYSITFWDYGQGFKPKDDDALCFAEIKSSVNCIDKKALLIVSNDNAGDVYFTVDNARYRLDNSNIIKIEDW
ncbi:DUF943 family protein [Siccibacter turicensis]|uniref:DUF943 family protein n=1 Tax=Siccibacter turicensis TaxID=357233 RepID=UPI003F544E26